MDKKTPDIWIIRNPDQATRSKVIKYAQENNLEPAEALAVLLKFAFDLLGDEPDKTS